MGDILSGLVRGEHEQVCLDAGLYSPGHNILSRLEQMQREAFLDCQKGSCDLQELFGARPKI